MRCLSILSAGEKFPLILVFGKAGQVSTVVPVESASATQSDTPDMGHMDMKYGQALCDPSDNRGVRARCRN
jgi:hypothetical protein